MCFVQDEQYVLAVGVFSSEELAESEYEIDFVVEPLPHVERRGYEIEEVEGLEERVGYVCHERTVAQAFQECIDQRS